MLTPYTCATRQGRVYKELEHAQVSYYTRNSHVSYYIDRYRTTVNSERKSIKKAIDKLATKNQN